MIVLCYEYAKEYDITFNPKKPVCIKYKYCILLLLLLLSLEAKLILMNMCQLVDFLCNGQGV